MGGPNRRQSGRSGVNVLSYLGVLPESPTNFVSFERDPTTLDNKNWYIGDEWENRTTNDVWKLVNKDGGVATWVKFLNGGGGGNVLGTLTADAGGVINPDAADNINILGGLNVNTVGTANTITVNLDQGTADGELLTMNTTTGIAEWNTLVEGANINITNGPGSVTISALAGPGGDLTLVGNDGSTATSVANTVNVLGASPIVTSGDLADTFTIETDGTLATSYLADDANSAVPAAGILTVAGGQNVNTEAAGSTVTVNVNDTYQVVVDPGSLEIGTVDNTELLGSISIADLKVLLGLP